MPKYDFRVGGEPAAIMVDKAPEGFTATVAGRVFQIVPMANKSLRIIDAEGRTVTGAAVWHKGICYVDIDGYQLEVEELLQDSPGGSAADQQADKDKIFAPMPGKIVKLLVAVGDEVQPKQPMVIVEAMKMENQVNAKAKGRVKAVHFAAGDQVNTEAPIIELELLD